MDEFTENPIPPSETQSKKPEKGPSQPLVPAQTTEEKPSPKKITRRDFLRLAALGTATALVGRSQPQPQEVVSPPVAEEPPPPPASQEVQATPEKEPVSYTPALIVGMPPSQEALDPLQKEGVLSPNVMPFDDKEFFERLTGKTYADVEAQFQEAANSDNPFKQLQEKGYVNEAVSMGLGVLWKELENDTGGAAQRFRKSQNKAYAEQMLEPIPLQPQELLPIQKYFNPIEPKGVNEKGDLIFDVSIDHKLLGNDLAKMSDDIITLKFPVGKVTITIAQDVPVEDLKDLSLGWVGGGGFLSDIIYKRLGAYIGIKAYQDAESLQALGELAAAVPEKFIVAQAPRNSADLRATLQNVPMDASKNFAVVASWEGLIDPPGPLAGFEGPTDVVYYVPSNSNDEATEVAAEWLIEQGIKNPEEAKRLLTEHARDYQGKYRVLEFGTLPHGLNWDDQEIYKPAKD